MLTVVTVVLCVSMLHCSTTALCCIIMSSKTTTWRVPCLCLASEIVDTSSSMRWFHSVLIRSWFVLGTFRACMFCRSSCL